MDRRGFLGAVGGAAAGVLAVPERLFAAEPRAVDRPSILFALGDDHGWPHAGAYAGEGMLLYPGGDAGLAGPVGTIRLKNIREGFEDFEYLAILDRAKLRSEADAIVRPLAESWFKWDPDPAAYQAARAKLAELILKNAK